MHRITPGGNAHTYAHVNCVYVNTFLGCPDQKTNTQTVANTGAAKHTCRLINHTPASPSTPLPSSLNKYQADFLDKDHLSSLPHLSLALSSFASCNSVRWLPVDRRDLVVLRLDLCIKAPCLKWCKGAGVLSNKSCVHNVPE